MGMEGLTLGSENEKANAQRSVSHGLADLALPALGPLEPIRVELVVHQGLANLFRGVEHEGAVLHDLLVEDLTGDKDEAGGLCRVLGDLDDNGIALALEHTVMILFNLGPTIT